MGTDKAFLPAPGSDIPLWQWQLRTLEQLEPTQIFWSGPVRPGLPAHLHRIDDAVPGAGPLAGIAACLEASKSDLLLVLAVDLPRITSRFLTGLLARCTSQKGIVTKHGDFFEPLAAFYPKSLAGLAREHLHAGRYAMQDFVREGLRHGNLHSLSLSEEEAVLFKNLNHPADLRG